MQYKSAFRIIRTSEELPVSAIAQNKFPTTTGTFTVLHPIITGQLGVFGFGNVLLDFNFILIESSFLNSFYYCCDLFIRQQYDTMRRYHVIQIEKMCYFSA